MYKTLLKYNNINKDNIIWKINSYHLYLEFELNKDIENEVILPPKLLGKCDEWKIIDKNTKIFYGKWNIKKIDKDNIDKFHNILKKYTN